MTAITPYPDKVIVSFIGDNEFMVKMKSTTLRRITFIWSLRITVVLECVPHPDTFFNVSVSADTSAYSISGMTLPRTECQ
jgi:hypothetical protein